MKPFTNILNLVFTLFICVLFQHPFYSQELQWAHGIGSATTSSNLRGQSVITDNLNNVFNVGSFANNVDFDYGSGTTILNTNSNSVDPYVAKYNDIGDLVWVRQFPDNGTNDHDVATSIVLDGAGNVYVYGYFSSTNDFDPGAGVFNMTSSGGSDCFVVKLDNSGNFIWAIKFGGTGSEGNRTKSMVLDNNGDLVLTGWFANGTTVDFDPGVGVTNLTGGGGFAMKLNTSSILIWAVHSITGISIPYELSVDLNRNVFITGQFSGTSDLNPGAGTANLVSAGSNDIFLQKLNSLGVYQWAFRLGGLYFDRALGIFVDDLGDVYIGGGFKNTVDFDPGAGTQNLSTGGTGTEKGFVAKYSSSGQYVWSHLVNSSSTNSVSSLVETIEMDNAGNLYFGGYFQGTLYGGLVSGPSFVDIFICKILSSNGTSVVAWEMGGDGFESITDMDIRDCEVHTTGYYNCGSPSDADFDPGSGVYFLPCIGTNNDHGFLVKFLLPPPLVDATSNAPVCDGTPIIFDEIVGEGISWSWVTNGTATIDSPNSQSTTITGATEGEILTVTVTDLNGCIDTAQAIFHDCVLLPIELLDFNAIKEKKSTVNLIWSTASEINNDYFTVYHSQDGIDFESIGIVDGVDNSQTVLNYSLVHQYPKLGLNYYLLKQTDYNGIERYSTIQVVKFDLQDNEITIFPNPAKEKITVQSNQKIRSINIFSLTGSLVYAVDSLSITQLEITVDSFGKGIYFLELTDINGKSQVRKIEIQ